MKREEFVFTVGYEGNVAIVDGASARKLGNLSSRELAERGQYRHAFRAAIFDGSKSIEDLRVYFRDHTSIGDKTAAELKRLFGVFEVRDDVTKVQRV